MKLALSVALLSLCFLSACDVDEPPPRVRHHVAKYPQEPTEQQYPPQQQPFNPNGPVQPDANAQQEAPVGPGPAPTAAAPTKVAKGDFPYGIPVPGKKN